MWTRGGSLREGAMRCVLIFLTAFAAAGSMPARAGQTDQQKDVTFKIKVPLTFKGRVVSGSLRKSDIPALLDLPVRNGDTDPKSEYGVEMTRRDGKKTFMVYTCRQWKRATAEGAYSATTYDMAMESSLISTCRALFELQSAKVPIKSFLENPRVTLNDTNLLPAAMLAVMPEDEAEERRLAGKTISQVVARKDIQAASGGVLTVSYDGLMQRFEEVARADFNGDGIEDILVFTGGSAEEGTMSYSDYILLTRTSSSGPLKVIPINETPSKTN